MKREDKLLRRPPMSGKEDGSPSFRALHYGGGVGGSVPFEWESQPGTPKHALRHHEDARPIQPLTPPPSHYQCHRRLPTKTSPGSRLLDLAVFPRLRSWSWSWSADKVKDVVPLTPSSSMALIPHDYDMSRYHQTTRRRRRRMKIFYSTPSIDYAPDHGRIQLFSSGVTGPHPFF
ncbi:PREDICTED: uncharacterized protein LOC104816170 [Tarenaya hassleriana]|uniref:uncharacterized protein LOC104816170 n=1 Tax=Tarenaya hassleriana TaxID=28532 RepID=UPI00053C4638|nr:PREDICTED: uncharacterized protein LOC104816170 [Tarenaya hassleriana]